MAPKDLIGVFDSGIGGLGVLRHIRDELPEADLTYVADQGRAPYGTRPLEDVARISTEITTDLIDRGAGTVVIACNTASAAALHELRRLFPGTTFVGMEPAVKPAALGTSSGVIGVLATAATFQSELFESVVARFAGESEVVTAACPEWVELVEAGETEGPVVDRAVRARIAPLLDAGADTLVLGCTHFPFLMDVIVSVVGPGVTIVDPAPAVAKQVARVARGDGRGTVLVLSSGNAEQQSSLERYLDRIGLPVPAGSYRN
jgi:glutamate racemase